jgi:hypothetical protein
MEDFSKRVLDRAVSVLVSNIEADIIGGAANGIANMVDNDAAAFSFLNIMQAKQKLIENLAPDDEEDLSLFFSPTHNTKYLDAVKGLFVPAAQLGAQYRTGLAGLVAGVGWVGHSGHLSDLTTGTAAKGDTSYNVNGANQEGEYVTVDTGTTTFVVGDRITFAGSNAVHPETKADLGYLKQFVVKTAYPGGSGNIYISPSIVASGARKNVSASPTHTGTVSKLGAGNAEKTNRTMYFHRDFCAVAFADLENPSRYGAWGDTQVVDNVSCRVWRAADIVNGKFLSRIDVLYGYKVIRPQLGCIIHADG